MKAWINPLELDGILAVDKPRGIASHDVVSRIRRLFRIDKAGHGGTLDTNATGLLLILLGKATKFFDTLLAKDKAYACTMRLGRETNTQDEEGEVVAEKPFEYSVRHLVGDGAAVVFHRKDDALSRFFKGYAYLALVGGIFYGVV